MKNLELLEMRLLSHKEKRAKTIPFHPKRTLIKGENDTGKSSIIKSIYSCFGAPPETVHPSWRNADVYLLTTFRVEDSVFKLLKIRDSYSLFTEDNELVGTYTSITKGLGLKLASLFDFNLLLANRDKLQTIPPPMYLFLPYYIDQDAGWQKSWSSFDRLSMFTNYQKNVAYYHAGIKPNGYYKLLADAKALEYGKEEPLSQEKALSFVKERIEKKKLNVSFDINIDAYKNEIDRLLKLCEELKLQEERYKGILIDLQSDKIRLEEQIYIVKGAHKEVIKDYEYSNSIANHEHIDCPTCGQEYENSFSERFSIAVDEERCSVLLSELTSDLDKINKKIVAHHETLNETSGEVAEIRELLAKKQGEVTLATIIENEGNRTLQKAINDDMAEIHDNISAIDSNIRNLKNQMSKFDDRKRTEEILNYYRQFMDLHLRILDVSNLPKETYKKIEARIKETGSDLPRAILAYTYAVLKTIKEYGSSTFCPIVIDSPNQQDQDDKNHLKLLNFINEHTPKDCQLILGLVDDCGIDFGGDVVVMTEKDFALSKDEYSKVARYFEPYETMNLDSQLNA